MGFELQTQKDRRVSGSGFELIAAKTIWKDVICGGDGEGWSPGMARRCWFQWRAFATVDDCAREGDDD